MPARKQASGSRSAVIRKVTPKRRPAKKSAAKKSSPRGLAMPSGSNDRVSIRKISNGYLVSRSSDGPNGYKETEMFYPEKPRIDVS